MWWVREISAPLTWAAYFMWNYSRPTVLLPSVRASSSAPTDLPAVISLLKTRYIPDITNSGHTPGGCSISTWRSTDTRKTTHTISITTGWRPTISVIGRGFTPVCFPYMSVPTRPATMLSSGCTVVINNVYHQHRSRHWKPCFFLRAAQWLSACPVVWLSSLQTSREPLST